MFELISKDEVMDILWRAREEGPCDVRSLIWQVKDLPNERKTGNWDYVNGGTYKCSECGKRTTFPTSYCPDCGSLNSIKPYGCERAFRKGDLVHIPHSEDLFLISAILDGDKVEIIDAECGSGEERHFEVHCSDLTFYDSL